MSKYAKSIVLEMLRETFGDIQNVNWHGKGVDFEVQEPRTRQPPLRIERRNFMFELMQTRSGIECSYMYRVDTML